MALYIYEWGSEGSMGLCIGREAQQEVEAQHQAQQEIHILRQQVADLIDQNERLLQERNRVRHERRRLIAYIAALEDEGDVDAEEVIEYRRYYHMTDTLGENQVPLGGEPSSDEQEMMHEDEESTTAEASGEGTGTGTASGGGSP